MSSIGTSSMQTGNIAQIFEQMSQLVNNSTNSIPDAMQQIQTNSNNGMLDPMQMTQLQMLMQNYMAMIQMYSAIVKDIGDLDKTVTSNIGQ